MQVPPKFLEYHHFGKELYLTSLGRHVQGMDDISKARRLETFGFLPLYLWKIVAGLALNPKEGSLRTVFRIVMLFLLPGESYSSSHLPKCMSISLLVLWHYHLEVWHK